MAHTLARLVYRMLKYGQQCVDKGAEYYQQRNRHQIEFVRKSCPSRPAGHTSPCLKLSLKKVLEELVLEEKRLRN